MDNRGIDQDPGWINRKIHEMQRSIEALRSERRFLNLPTTSATANVVVDATTGALSRSTSSRRYKQDIADLDIDIPAILKMRPRIWRDRRDVADDPGTAPRYAGFVAEELHDAGLGVFVGYDTEGKPESVAYDRLTVALLILAKFLMARITAMTTRVAASEKAVTDLTTRATAQDATIADLTARVAALENPPAPPEPAPTSPTT